MVANLSDDDMRNLAAYFAAQKPKPGAAKDRALVAAGQKLYRGGDSETGVPACSGCHSPDGAGIPAQYPRLAGQHGEYTVAQLKAFRSRRARQRSQRDDAHDRRPPDRQGDGRGRRIHLRA